MRLFGLVVANVVLGAAVARSPFGTPLLFEDDFSLFRHVIVPVAIGLAVGMLEARLFDFRAVLLSWAFVVAVAAVAVVVVAEVVALWFTFGVVAVGASSAAVMMMYRGLHTGRRPAARLDG